MALRIDASGSPDAPTPPPAAAPPPSRPAPLALVRWLSAPLKALGCLTSAVTILAVGGTAAGAPGIGIAGVLVLLAVPVVGFTRNQVFLTTRGHEFASTVEEVQALKASDAIAFAQPFATLFRKISADSQNPAVDGPPWNGQNCTILFIDIAGFGGHHRNDADRRRVRTAMYDVLRTALKDSDVLWDACHQEDRGDGALIVVPPTIATRAVVDPLFARLFDGLRQHNEQSAAGRRIQLRVALHVGPVVSDPEGVTGEAIVHTARLLDASILKREIAETSAHLGVIVSTFVYDAVIKHENGSVEPTSYRRVSFQGKESKITGWMHLAGQPAPRRSMRIRGRAVPHGVPRPAFTRTVSRLRHRRESGWRSPAPRRWGSPAPPPPHHPAR